MRAVALVAVALLLGSCGDEADPPPLGAASNEVILRPQGSLVPGERTTVAVEANPAEHLTGGVCLTVDRWSSGEWQPAWMIQPRMGTSVEIKNDEATCPAMGTTLPTSFTFTVPDVGEGTYRLGYSFVRDDGNEAKQELPTDGLAAYVFAVESV